MLKRILAAFIGLVVWTALWLGGNAGLRAVSPQNYLEDGSTRNFGLLLTTLVLSVVCSIVAGYVTAMVAKAQAVNAVWILAITNLAIGIFVQIGYWDVMPVWYHLSFLALLVPGVILGGRLRGSGSAVA